MHLFGLNWQLQESEGYGAFENGGGRDTTPNTFMVPTDNGEFLRSFLLNMGVRGSKVTAFECSTVIVALHGNILTSLAFSACFPVSSSIRLNSDCI